MKTRLFSIFLVILTYMYGYTATIKGLVRSNNKPLEFVNVGIAGTNYGSITNALGKFEINNVVSGNYKIVASSLGYKSDTLHIKVNDSETKNISFTLKETNTNLDEVVISGTLKETYISESAVAIEVITPKLFQKNPTPSIFESLNMINGVRPQMQCNVCNTGDIHINGMEGPYTMVMIDGMPIVSALGSVYGLMGIPNSIIQRIEVQKGPSSTLYGSEAVGGLINIITKQPSNSPKFAFDLFGTSYNEYNADVSLKYKLSRKIDVLSSATLFYFDKIWDINHDNFTDVTLQKRYAFFNKLSFTHSSGKQSNLAVRYYYEDRWGGETQWTKKYRGKDVYYGESIYTNRIELIGNSPIKLFKSNYNLQYSLNKHNQNSAYGITPFNANQIIVFTQLTKNILLGRNDLMIGLANRYINYDDNTIITEKNKGDEKVNYPTITYLPGFFIQDEFTINPNNIILGGIRYDYNSHHGNIFSPRINWKWNINAFNTLRAGIGNGYRVVNLFSEDHAAFNGARDIVIKETLKPEQSWNTNINYSKFISTRSGFLTIDANFFYTYFSNKIVADYFSDHTKVIFDNLNGFGINRGIGIQTHYSFLMPLKLSVGFTYMDLYLKEKNLLGEISTRRQVQTPPFTSNFVLTYEFVKPKLTIDLNGNVYSPMLLPVLPNDYRPDHSPWFSIINLQATKEIKSKWQIYGGVKNILNFIPKDPIMRPFDPFDKNVNDPINNPNGYTFDPGYNYAPIQKIRLFIGVRMKI